MTKLFKPGSLKVIIRGDHSIELYDSRLCCLCRSFIHVGMIKWRRGKSVGE